MSFPDAFHFLSFPLPGFSSYTDYFFLVLIYVRISSNSFTLDLKKVNLMLTIIFLKEFNANFICIL